MKVLGAILSYNPNTCLPLKKTAMCPNSTSLVTQFEIAVLLAPLVIAYTQNLSVAPRKLSLTRVRC